jgi:hypothetical protein
VNCVTPPPGSEGKPRILVVDDDMMATMYLGQILTNLGCHVVKAAGVTCGVNIVRTQHIDGAFVDVSVFGAAIDPVVTELLARAVPFAFVTDCEPDGLPVECQSHPLFSKRIVLRKLSGWLAQAPHRRQHPEVAPSL